MAKRRWVASSVVVVLGAIGVASCSSSNAGTESAASTPSAGDGGAAGKGAGASGHGGAAAGGSSAGTGGTAMGAECSTDADCKAMAPAIDPPGCATAKCDTVAKRCKYLGPDKDMDGHPDAKCKVAGVPTGDDCDDGDPKVVPGAMRACSADDSGNVITWPKTDASGKPVGVCKEGTQSCSSGTWTKCMGTVAPSKEKCNGLDDDCNGVVDDDPSDGSAWAYDCDGDFHGSMVYPTVVSCSQPTQPPAGCPSKDATKECSTCDPSKWKMVSTLIGVADDCADGDGSVHPGAMEVCDGKDNDCDGKPDEGCMCEVGQPCGSDTTCNKGTYTACTPGLPGTCSAGPPQTKVTYCPDADGDGYCVLTQCSDYCPASPPDPSKKLKPKTSCTSTTKTDCADADPTINPGAGDPCDGIDNDCDGVPDEGCGCKPTDPPQACDTTAQGTPIKWPKVDANGNPYGQCKRGSQMCVSNAWGTCTGAVPPAPRDCTSSLDNDCDGLPDNTKDSVCQCQAGDTQPCTGGPNNCPGTQQCSVTSASATWGACSAPDQCNCVAGQTQACQSANGVCQGSQTCANGVWGPCQVNGATLPADCQCTPGQTTPCGGAACATTLACAGFYYPACTIPGNCACTPGQTTTCGGAACQTTIACDGSYQWPACPVPSNCACAPGQTTTCGGAACPTTIACSNYQWPSCPAPGDCNCNDPGSYNTCYSQDGFNCQGSAYCDAYHLGTCSAQPAHCPPGWPGTQCGNSCAIDPSTNDEYSGTLSDYGTSPGTVIWTANLPWSFPASVPSNVINAWFTFSYDGSGGCYNSGTEAIAVTCEGGASFTVSEHDAGYPGGGGSSFPVGSVGRWCNVTKNEGWTPFAQGACHRNIHVQFYVDCNTLGIACSWP